jgi:predicted MFS family arabinose efflux permease
MWLGDIRGQRRVVLGCFLCQLGLGFTYLFSPLLREVTADLGWTRATFASARAPYLLVIAAASPFVGQLTARYGARAVLSGAALVLGATFVALARMTEVWELYAANLLWGLFVTGLGDVVVGAVLVRALERARGLALGLVYSASNLGGALLPPAFAALATRFGWRHALLVLAAGGVALVLPAAQLTGRRAGGAAARGAEAGVGGPPALGLRDAMRTPSFWILAAALFAFFFTFLGVNDAFVSLLVDAGSTREEAAALYATAVATGGFSKLLAGFLADRVAPRTALLVDFALLALAGALLLAVPRPGFLQAFLVSYGLAVAARDVIYPLVVSWCFGARSMPEVYGALMAVLALGGTAGSVFPQAAHDATGSYAPAFVVYAALNGAALLALTRIRREAPAA